VVKVSVVVPARNEEARIGACLDSLLRQDYPRDAYEVIVVDDASTDRTAEVAADFGVRVLRCGGAPSSSGTAARNVGVACARGEVVAFTDADCVAEPDWLRKLVAPFRDLTVGVCGGDVVGAGGSLVTRYLERSGAFRLESLWRAQPWPIFVTANVAYRKTVFQVLGGFDPSLNAASDLEMTWRVARDGRFRLVCCPGAVVYHQHPATVRGLYEQWRGYGAGRARVVAKLWGSAAARKDGWRQGGVALSASVLSPLRVVRRLAAVGREERGYPVFPFLDAVRAVAFATGYWVATSGWSPGGSWRERASEVHAGPSRVPWRAGSEELR
jgi:cellulose synthase/poly-beta-1,6-N-acetylglucosamine synthase-like glycosyltransferase